MSRMEYVIRVKYATEYITRVTYSVGYDNLAHEKCIGLDEVSICLFFCCFFFNDLIQTFVFCSKYLCHTCIFVHVYVYCMCST